jgi:HprK-related kinase A
LTLADLPPEVLSRQLRTGTLRLRVGPFIVSVRSSLQSVRHSLLSLYAWHRVAEPGDGAHFAIHVDPPRGLRRFVRRQVQFEGNGSRPFLPLPIGMAPLLFEGAINWCVGAFAHHLVVLHAATVEKDGVGLLMPAAPGSGKSTLCAALIGRGWRLLSDEFALIDPATGELLPVPKPIALKDGSIAVIRAWSPDAWLSVPLINLEGQLHACQRPPEASVAASGERCMPRLVVIPKFLAGAEAAVSRLTRARTVMHLADNAFNYNLHGQRGFELLAEIADAAPAAILQYSNLEEGVRIVNRLAESARR